MKKSIFKLAAILIILFTNPLFAQADPGQDPDIPAPIDGYIWVLAVLAITFAVVKFRAIYKQYHSSKV